MATETSAQAAKQLQKKPNTLASLARALLHDAQEGSKQNAHADADGTAHLPAFPTFTAPVPLEETEAGMDGSAGEAESKARAAKHWTPEEKLKLRQLVEESRSKYSQRVNWNEVQRHFKNRTGVACRFAYLALETQDGAGVREKLKQRNLPSRRVFTPAEHQALTGVVRKHGERNWARVAEEMKKATGIARAKTAYRTCWHLALNPKARAAPEWTEEKTARLRELVKAHGPDEVFIAFKFFPEYTPYIIRELISSLDTILAAIYAAAAVAAPAKGKHSASLSAPTTSPPAPTSSPSTSGTTYDTSVAEYSFDDAGYTYCQAAFPSPKSYKPVPNASLEFVQLIVRHGDRTTEQILPNEDSTWTCDGVEEDIYLHGPKQPNDNTTGTVKQVIEIPEWNKKYGFSNQIWKGSCESGQLTDRGKAQHRYLGSQLRQIYVDDLKFLPSKLKNADSVYLRSTYSWRTKNSAESLLGGLWPNRGHGAADAITLHSYPQSIETMFDNSDACPKIKDLSKKIIKSDQYKKFLSDENDLMTKLNSNFGVDGSKWTEKWSKQLDVLLPRHCYNMKLPCNTTANNCPTDSDVAQTMRNGHYQYAFMYRDHPLSPKYTRLSIGSFLGTLRDQLQDYIAGRLGKLKIAIYSGHDSTVAPILGVFKSSNRHMLWPPYASNLIFELWKQKKDGGYVVRVIHNGETLKLQSGAEWCDLESCPVEKFTGYFKDYIPDDIAAECASD
ncbi:hypothetical protein GGI12_001008 [Dipsacomyces acuminosporus]|nr:hypothetical protein GGI12_001008 [Dipsacomyces acuminosporus]